MTFSQFERARLVEFSYQEAARTGSLACARAVCYVLRNRIRAGWHDGNWIEVIEKAAEAEGNEAEPRIPLDSTGGIFRGLLRDVDDIYYASSSGDETETVVGPALYYQFIDRPQRQWFTENVVRDHENHPLRAHIGCMVVFD